MFFCQGIKIFFGAQVLKSWKLKCGGADFFEGAEVASRVFGGADFSAVVNEEIGGAEPSFFREELHEVLFDFFWVARFGKTEAL